MIFSAVLRVLRASAFNFNRKKIRVVGQTWQIQSPKMKKQFKAISGSIVAPRGFLASGVFCDIKRLGTGKGSNKGQKRDLALIVSEVPATVAGMFTTNQVCAAPVKVCVERVKKGTARAVVINSGNANACTGKPGLQDAREMVRYTERALNLPQGSVLVG